MVVMLMLVVVVVVVVVMERKFVFQYDRSFPRHRWL